MYILNVSINAKVTGVNKTNKSNRCSEVTADKSTAVVIFTVRLIDGERSVSQKAQVCGS